MFKWNAVGVVTASCTGVAIAFLAISPAISLIIFLALSAYLAGAYIAETHKRQISQLFNSTESSETLDEELKKEKNS